MLKLYVLTIVIIVCISSLFMWRYIVHSRKLKGDFWVTVNEDGNARPWALNQSDTTTKFSKYLDTKQFHADSRRDAPQNVLIKASPAFIVNGDESTESEIQWGTRLLAGTMSKGGSMKYGDSTTSVMGDMPASLRE